MCGIIGYTGPKESKSLGIEALKRLEYRGYDSAGMCTVTKNTIKDYKVAGKVDELEQKISDFNFDDNTVLFHSRWATHGKPTRKNAHPQFDCNKKFAVVHNGIIENYNELKKKLSENHKFTSETDTEIIAHLIEDFYDGNLEVAVLKALRMLEGAYGIAVVSSEEPEKIVAARMSSPVVVSVNESGGFVASDPAAIVEHSSKMTFLEDGEIATVTQNELEITDLENVKKEVNTVEIEWDIEEAKKSGYEHYMLKEMMEQPRSIKNTMRGRLIVEEGDVKLGGLEKVEDQLRHIEKLNILACGTSHYSALLGKYLIEEISGLDVEVGLASEYRYREKTQTSKEGYLFVSQSGETADTIKALEKANQSGALTLGIVNVVGSTIARKTDAGIYNHAGPEIGVASTKAFTSQLTVLTMLAVYLGRQRSLRQSEASKILQELERIPELVEQILKSRDSIKQKAKKYKDYQNFLYIGRKYNYPTALEGALKLKEISYIHAEGYSAAEMKHGPIALIDDKFPTLAICLKNSLYSKMISNIEEIKARDGPVIALGNENDENLEEIVDDMITVPNVIEQLSPIIAVIPLQLFSYYVSVFKGLNPDKPRNLSKVVTVE